MTHAHTPSFGFDMPAITLPSGEVVRAPHREWCENHAKWRWLLDSYEGGDAYRFAQYPPPAEANRQLLPVDWVSRYMFNLVPHKREWDDRDRMRTNEDYAMRLLRTPVPTFVQEAVDKHLGKIYNQAIKREGPDALAAWWMDVDGTGASMGEYASATIAPLLMVLGCIDVLIDMPAAPDGEVVKTRADELRLGIAGARISYILPQNTVWWKLDAVGEYTEVLVRECGDDGDSWVYWNAEMWRRYDANGKPTDGPRGGDTHAFGRVPMFRAFDDPKRPRCRNVAMPRYEAVAEIQREYYNRDSELILSDAVQAHPMIQGPQDLLDSGGEEDDSVPLGPGWILPKKKTNNGTSVSYEGWEVLEFPKGGADSLRQNKADLRDSADRAACLTKPAGGGAYGDTTGQSGVSKRIDQTEGNELLGEIAGVLQRMELKAAGLAAIVLGLTVGPDEEIKVEYPRRYDLFGLDEFMGFAERFEGVLSTVGSLPETESKILSKAVRLGLPGLDDDDYAEIDEEIEAFVARQAKPPPPPVPPPAIPRLAVAPSTTDQPAPEDQPVDPESDPDPNGTEEEID